MPLGRKVGLDPSDIVLDGEPASLSSKKWAEPPIFWPMSIVRKWLDGSRCQLVWRRPLPKEHCVRWQPSSLSPKRGQSPQFSAHVYCGQMAGWIKLPLGMDVGVEPNDIMLDGDPAFLCRKGAEPLPIFSPCLLWPNGCMDQDATWYGGRSRPRPHCARWGPLLPLPKKGAQPPQFSARVCCGQTA